MLNLIVAPKKHNNKAEKFTKKIVKYLKTENVEYSVYFSVEWQDIGESVRELVSIGQTEFVVIGDDIVLNEFLNSLKDLNKIKLGIIPTNRHNDFARYLNLSHHPIQAIKTILNKNIEEIDILLANDQMVINNIILGADVEIEDIYHQYTWKSPVTKKIAKNQVFKNFKGIELSFGNKTKLKTGNIYQMVIANGGLNNGKPVSPLSNVKDGLFNLLYINTSNENIKSAMLFNNGQHVYNKETKQQWLSYLKICSPDNKIKAIVDGKIVNFEKLEITVIENGLKIYK